MCSHYFSVITEFSLAEERVNIFKAAWTDNINDRFVSSHSYLLSQTLVPVTCKNRKQVNFLYSLFHHKDFVLRIVHHLYSLQTLFRKIDYFKIISLKNILNSYHI